MASAHLQTGNGARLSNRARALIASRSIAQAKRQTANLVFSDNPQAAALSALGTSNYALRVHLRSQPRTKAGAPVSSMYRGRVQSNASRLPGSWSDSYHYKAMPMVIASDYLAAMMARKAMIPSKRAWQNVQTLRYQEFSPTKLAVITKTKRLKIGDGTGHYQPPSELTMRGEPSLYDECTEPLPEGLSNYWLYHWTADLGHTGYSYLGRVLYGPMAGARAYEQEESVRFSKRARVRYHMPEPLPPDTNGKVRSVKRAIPNLDAMLDDWRGRQMIAWLEMLGVNL